MGARETALRVLAACRNNNAWADAALKAQLNRDGLVGADAALCKDLATIRLYCFSEDLLTGKEYRTCKIAEFNKKLLHLGIQSAFLPEF